MKVFITLTFLLSSFITYACEVPDEEIQSVGGPVTDGSSSSITERRSVSRFSAAHSDSSGNATINSDCWGNVTAYGYPGPGWSWAGSFTWTFIGSGGGGGNPAVVPSDAKLDYCRRREALDQLEAILSATTITSSVMTGLSVAEGSNNFARAYYSTAYQDINRYLTVGMHIDGGPTAIITNWARADINWNQYLTNWNSVAPRRIDNNGNETNSPQFPDMESGGLEHIFATHLMSLGLGSGQTSDSTASNAAETFLGVDPQPHISCD